jgi:hypothetical protein
MTIGGATYISTIFPLIWHDIMNDHTIQQVRGWSTDNECDSATFYTGVCTKPEESELSCMWVLCLSILSTFLPVSDCILKLSW